MKHATIKFHAIDLMTSTHSCPLLLNENGSIFNDAEVARVKGAYYKAVLEGNNVITFYFRDRQLDNHVAHRYAVAVDWLHTTEKLAGRHKTTRATTIAERIVQQRLLYMIRVINTSNI